MNHLQHLESVALSDCAVLEMKEGTYKGSWKRAGGRSAWFMARRNLDRLITMMSPKEFPDFIKTFENVRDTVSMLDHIVHYDSGAYTTKNLPGTIEATRAILEMLMDSYTSEDIFMKIREKPNGEDGTVLACLRDARRYFTLVEAEMIAEGVVEPESKTYEQETAVVDPQFSEWDGREIDTLILQMEDGNRYTISNISNFQMKREDGVCAITVRRVASPPPPTEFAMPSGGGYAQEQMKRHVPIRELKPGFDEVISDGVLHKEGSPRQSLISEERVSDGGSQHASANPLFPWFINKAEILLMFERVGNVVDLFYTQKAADVFTLVPVVESLKCPKEIWPFYDYAGTKLWIMKRDKVPHELENDFPRVLREMNSKEWEESTREFQFMYAQDPSDLKYKLRPEFDTWAKEPN